MFEILFYANLNCEDAAEMLQRIERHKNLMDSIKQELIVTVKEATPHCPWDAND